ncbi:MAG: tetratricopeptide repeat protein [Planctomycetota bacterium]|nr:tetratricopeptide repeat protein [Planctomycetota bacterium]
MSEPAASPSSSDDLLAAFLARHAEPTDGEIEALCEAHPERAAELRSVLAAHLEVQAGLPSTLSARSRARLHGDRGDGDTARRDSSFEAGRTVGDFVLVRLLGRGGMGEVWEAEEQSLRRKVALKLLLPGRVSEKAIDFFAREARAGGKLTHPGIVAVHGSGEIDGVHWIAMDLVEDGASLADFLEEVRGEAELPKDYYGQVADLMAKVADAMEVAHGAGVIHRDLKPANILISPDDTPKVGDFGLARVESEHGLSQTGDFAGTYYYMSPEQVMAKRMGIDHRTDVFSLGVVLYELLSLQRPFEGDTTHQIAQKVVMVDPADPRTLRSRVPDDLAVICAKTIEKNPDHRYSTMTELAADIRRHMAHEPILARPPTLVVRTTKWVRRNPTKSVAGALASVALVAISTLAWQLSQEKEKLAETNQQLQTKTEEAEHNADLATDRADELVVTNEELRVQRQEAEDARVEAASERDKARRRAEELGQVTAFQAGQLGGVDSVEMGLAIRARVLAEARSAGERAGRGEVDLDEERAVLKELLAGADFTGLALAVLEAEVFGEALRELEGFENQPLVQAVLLQSVAATMKDLGLLAGALEPQERALEIRRELLGEEHIDTLESTKTLGTLLSAMGRFEHAEGVLRELLETERRVLGDEHLATLITLNALGGVLHMTGELDAAEALFGEVEEVGRRTLGAEHVTTLNAINNLGILHHEGDRLDAAEPLYREALEISRRVSGDHGGDTLSSLNNLASLLAARGELDEALPLLNEVVAGQRRLLGDDHPTTLNSINNLADLLKDLGRMEEAERLFREGLDASRRTLGEAHWGTQALMNNLAALLSTAGRHAEAEPLFVRGLEASRRSLGEDHPRTLAMQGSLGICYQNLGRLADAERAMRAWLDGARGTLPPRHPDLLVPLSWLGRLLEQRGDLSGAEPLHREALEIRRASLGPEHLETLGSLTVLGGLLSRLGEWEEARVVLERACDGLGRTVGHDHPSTVRARQHLAEAEAGLATSRGGGG